MLTIFFSLRKNEEVAPWIRPSKKNTPKNFHTIIRSKRETEGKETAVVKDSFETSSNPRSKYVLEQIYERYQFILL